MLEFKFNYEIRREDGKRFDDKDIVFYLSRIGIPTEYPRSSHRMEEEKIYYFASETPLKEEHKQFLTKHGFNITEK